MQALPIATPPDLRQHGIHNQALLAVICADLTQPDTDATQTALELLQVTLNNF